MGLDEDVERRRAHDLPGRTAEADPPRNRLIAAGVGDDVSLGLLGGWCCPLGRGRTGIASDAEPVAILSAKAGAVWSVAFDPTSTTLAMATEDGTVRLWDWPTQSIKSTINAHRGVVWAARFGKNGELLATSGDDGRIKIWNAARGDLQQSFKHPNAVRGLAFAHDDRRSTPAIARAACGSGTWTRPTARRSRNAGRGLCRRHLAQR